VSCTAERLLDMLRAEIAALGHQGGILSPSIYDTAQVLRHVPPADPRPAVDWLLQQQHPDGGWGPEGFPLARHVPTLAAVLALLGASDTSPSRAAVERGLGFLRHRAKDWDFEGDLPEDIPVAVEIVLPRLLGEASTRGIELPRQPYQALLALGERRRALIARMNPRAGTAPAHAWESWGEQPSLEMLDGAKSIGHSPAATACWLRKRREQHPDGSQEEREVAQYLRAAAEATGADIPGVVPTVWPIYRFEQPWGLFALLTTGLISHPALQEVVRPQLDDLHRALRPEGLGMSDAFIFDGDITSTTLALLASTGREVDSRILEPFQRAGLFITYAHELQPSLTTNAHGLLALSVLGGDTSQSLRFLRERRGPDGVWRGDKWHGSWLYTTSQVLLALARASGGEELYQSGAEALIARQREDGGWGVGATSTPSETAYAIHALYGLRKASGAPGAEARRALRNAARWMETREDAPRVVERFWIGKELYAPYRVDRTFVLSARLALELDGELLAS
jgi:halimadienyl-diphosphate synthase